MGDFYYLRFFCIVHAGPLRVNQSFEAVRPAFAFIVVLVIITAGVVFDVIGIAVTAADETPFHSMASKRIRGARQSLILLRNAPRVSSFCNDVIGDICGVVSGVAAASIVYRIFTASGYISLIETVTGALIAAVTVGGKAFAKNIGINNANYIVYWVGRILSCFSFGKERSEVFWLSRNHHTIDILSRISGPEDLKGLSIRNWTPWAVKSGNV